MSNDPVYMREYMARRQRERVTAAREHLGGKCVRCGTTENLHFDHIDPETKSFNVTRNAGGRAHDKFWAEVNKCQLLCAPCHRKKTIVEDLGFQIAKGGHGTVSTYLYCKCDECKAAKSESNRLQRERKRQRALVI